MEDRRRRASAAVIAVAMVLFLFGCTLTATDPEKAHENATKNQGVENLPPLEDGEVVQSNAEIVIFSNVNDGVVRNGASAPVEFTVEESTRITYIQTYHWNDGQGVEPGRIGLKSQDGKTIGTWDATGTPGQGGVSNAYWEVSPDVLVEAGTYQVVDSDASTQSTNEMMGGAGQTVIRGFADE